MNKLMGAIYKTLDSDRCFTPRTTRALVHRVLGPIDLDPCTSLLNPLGARNFYTGVAPGVEVIPPHQVDGCVHWRWHPPDRGQRWAVFFNPPYGKNIVHWTNCAIQLSEREPQAQILALVPCRPGARWYAKASTHAQLLCELNGRLVFETPDGEPMRDGKGRPSCARWGCALLYWGPARTRIARILRKHGVVRLGRACPVRKLPAAPADDRQHALSFEGKAIPFIAPLCDPYACNGCPNCASPSLHIVR